MAASQYRQLGLRFVALYLVVWDISHSLDCESICKLQNICTSHVFSEIGACLLQKRWSTEKDDCSYHVNTVLHWYTIKGKLCHKNTGYILNITLGICYKFHKERKTVLGAKAICLREKSDGLIRVDNQKKYQFFTEHFNYVFIDGWLTSDTWTFSNGEPMIFLPFKSGEPNGDGRCLNIWGGLNDAPCTARLSFICEKHM